MLCNGQKQARWGKWLAVILLLLVPLACSAPMDPLEPTYQPVTPPPGGQTATGAAPVSEVTIYLVALEDNGASGPAVGCGDSLVAVTRPVTPTTQPIQAALNELFAIKDQRVGESGLYTALYQSNLVVDGVEVDANGAAAVSLSGQFALGGACDTPRFQGQIEQTVLAAPGVTSVQVTLNGVPIQQALSQQ